MRRNNQPLGAAQGIEYAAAYEPNVWIETTRAAVTPRRSRIARTLGAIASRAVLAFRPT